MPGWSEARSWLALESAAVLPEAAAAQRAALAAARTAQEAVARQVAIGIGEAIGLFAFPSVDGLGVTLDLPDGADPALVVRALLAENVTAQLTRDGNRDWATAAVAPWYRADDIDQVVLCVAKVVHVMFGLHPPMMATETHAACGWHGPVPSASATD